MKNYVSLLIQKIQTPVKKKSFALWGKFLIGIDRYPSKQPVARNYPLAIYPERLPGKVFQLFEVFSSGGGKVNTDPLISQIFSQV